MLRSFHNRKGQSTLEYIILIAVVLAALLTIQAYLKRGLMGRARQAADDIGEQYMTTETTHWQNTTQNQRKREIKTGTGSGSRDRTEAEGGLDGGGSLTVVNEFYETENSQSVYVVPDAADE